MDGKSIILALLCVNILLYLSGFQLTENDLLSRLTDKTNLENNTISLNTDVQNRIPQDPGSGAITTGTGLGFVDVVLIFWDFIKLLFNLVTAPVALFTIGLHPTISILLGIPFLIGTLLVIVQFARGANLWVFGRILEVYLEIL